MKNQYFGDQTDYIKYGILRGFAESGARLGIHWTLTDDDASSDGSRTKYLEAADQWRPYDPYIFDAIAQRVRSGDRRLRVVEELGFIPGAIQSFDRWETCPIARSQSLQNLIERLPAESIVFLDPDNGLEVASARPNTRAASKYVFFEEVKAIWLQGHSVIVYQHYPRVQRVPYVRQQLLRLREALPNMTEAALLTSHVAFLACIQHQHRQIAATALRQITSQWAPHVGALHLDGTVQEGRRVGAMIEPRQHALPL